MDDLVIDDQRYVSSKRAAQITGYAKDYIGQLCREGRVEARLVGRSWYVREAAIRDHRFGSQNSDQPEAETNVVTYAHDVSEIEPEPILEPTEPVEEFSPTVSMQEAWQEWFSRTRSEVPASEVVIQKIDPFQYEEAPEVTALFTDEVESVPAEAIEDEQDEHVVEEATYIPLKRMEAEAEEGTQSEVQTLPQPYIGHNRPMPKTKGTSYRALQVSLAAIAISVVAISTLATGLVNIGQGTMLAATINYISGTQIVSK